MRWIWILVASALLAATRPASAQASPDGGASFRLDLESEDGLITGSEFSLDPLGVTADEQLDGVATRRPASPRVPERPVVDGEVLSAIRAIRETQHRVQLRMDAGLAQVEVVLVFESSATEASDLVYRLALPAGASLAEVAGCVGEGCRPAGHATTVELTTQRLPQEATTSLQLRAAPVRKDHPLTIRVRYLVPITQHAGDLRLTLPARGTDPRVVPTEIQLRAAGVVDLQAAGAPVGEAPLRLETWQPCPIRARLPAAPRVHARLQSFPCGDLPCERLHLAAAPAPGQARPIVLAIDASPSTEGPARGRIASAIAAILAAAPTGSEVRALAFAAQARPLLAHASPSDQVSLATLARGAHLELGAATRFEALWEVAEPWVRSWRKRAPGRRPLIVMIGDGGITVGRDDPFAAAVAAGVEISVLNLADRPTRAPLADAVSASGGLLVAAGPEAEDAARGRDMQGLQAQVSRLFAPVSLTLDASESGPIRLRAGDALSLIERAGTLGPRAARSLVFQPRREAFEPAWAPALAAAWAQDPSPQAALKPATSLPASPLLGMLRQRIVPIARGCFRRDRAGRLNYSVRALFDFELAEREVIRAWVDGEISEVLRQCLLQAIDSLEIPRFEGRVRVRYPLTTEPHPPPPVIELHEDTADHIDTLFDPYADRP